MVNDVLRSRKSLTQSILDSVFGQGRFLTDVSRDPKLLMRMNELVLCHLGGSRGVCVAGGLSAFVDRRTSV